MAKNERFREAGRRVARLETKGEAALDLSDLGLRELPDELGNLTALQGLNLDNNDLIELPEWLGKLNELRWLYVRGNELSRLPQCLVDCPREKLCMANAS